MNVAAFNAKTHEAPKRTPKTPPSTGPIAIPECTPIVTRLFAHDSCDSSSTRFGIAAREAEKNGSSAIAEPKASPISCIGVRANAMARKNAAATASDSTMTFRRSNRSPSAPANGPRSPATPNVSSSESACIAGECVRSHTVKLSAVYAAAPPVTEMSRPAARRRIFVRAVVVAVHGAAPEGAGAGRIGGTGARERAGASDGARVSCRDHVRSIVTTTVPRASDSGGAPMGSELGLRRDVNRG